MNIEQVDPRALRAYERNARVHPKNQREALVASIKRFGFRVPVLIDSEGCLVAGHARTEAAIEAGLDTIPALRVADLSAEELRAFRLADNRLAEMSSWDEELLAAEMQALQQIDVRIDDFGFSPQWLRGELGELFEPAQPAQDSDDEPVEVHEKQVTKRGDIWILREHRVGCGDSTDQAHLAALFDGAVPNLMVTDPPYGVRYDPNWRNNVNVARQARGHSKPHRVPNDDRADWTPVWKLFPGNIAYVWHGGLHAATVAASLQAADFELRAQIIWAKQHMILSRGAYHWQHEPCWYAVRAGAKAEWNTDRKQTTLWQIATHVGFLKGKGDDEAEAHGTQKPIECMLRPILHNSRKGGGVFDPFLGSGSTLLAAERAERVCYGSELDPKFVDVAVRRWQRRTGMVAMEAHTGRRFE